MDVNGSNMNVLIVDPDASFAELLGSHLQQRGIQSKAVSNPNDALEDIKNGNYKFVISELELPEYSGWVLSSNIRELKNKSMPEILLISEEQLVNIEMAHKVGACTMLGKPIKFDVLVDTIEHYGRKSGALRKFERIDVDSRILGSMQGQLITSQGATQSFEVSNIGRGGFYMEIPVEMLKGTQVLKGQMIEFKAKLSMVPEFYLVGKGIVRWTKESIFTVGAGVEFLQLDADAEDLLNAYVQLFRIKSFVPSKNHY